MSTAILATKVYIPPPRSKMVLRPRLVQPLDEGLCQNQVSGHKLTLISAPAGFGKTTLVGEWVAGCDRPIAWLSLDERDNDPARFLTYLIAALQTVAANIGDRLSGALQSPQLPPLEPFLTALLNEIAAIQENFILVLDDYHVIDASPVDEALAFLLENLPPHMHLVIATREDPGLPLALLRARGQLTELRAADLRFTNSEAADFLKRVMGLSLSDEDIAALEARTEGWIAGLQLAGLAMQGISNQGRKDTASFIQSFTGSHHFVMDYLVEEVLQQQSQNLQNFLLCTSILDRLCGPLCDAVLENGESRVENRKTVNDSRFSTLDSQTILEYLERANLFIVPLDNERRWYRYHHLFADLLRQRLLQQQPLQKGGAAPALHPESHLNDLHIRASQWYEDNGFPLEAFHHAAAANDVDRAERLIEGKGIPLHFSGAAAAVLVWLQSLPQVVLNARPSLWWRYAALLLINGQTTGVEEKLQAAEAAIHAATAVSAPDLPGAAVDDKTRNLIGQIAAARATLALTRYQADAMLTQSRRALEYLHPTSLFSRANANWTMGYAYLLHGDRTAARQALMESISLSRASGAMFTLILATIGLGNVQEADNQLHQAAETYRRVVQWAGDQPQQIIYEAHLGLARILYEWNDLEGAEQHGQQSLKLARRYETVIDRYILCEVFLARLKLARGDVSGAAALLAETSQSARRQNFVHRIPEVAAAQVITLLRQGNVSAAAHLVQEHSFPLSLARVHLAQGNPPAALAVLQAFRQQMEARGWQDERLKAMVLQAVAFYAAGEKEKAVELLGDALVLAEPDGFMRTFIDEGAPVLELLPEAMVLGIMPDYVAKLLAAFEAEPPQVGDRPSNGSTAATLTPPLIEPLSQREREVLQLIAQGLSNHEISQRLFLALSTIKGHNRIIFNKLQVQRRTEAVARARELGLL